MGWAVCHSHIHSQTHPNRKTSNLYKFKFHFLTWICDFRFVSVQKGSDQFGSVRFSSVQCPVRFSSVQCPVLFSSVWFGSVRFGSVRFGSVRFGWPRSPASCRQRSTAVHTTQPKRAGSPPDNRHRDGGLLLHPLHGFRLRPLLEPRPVGSETHHVV